VTRSHSDIPDIERALGSLPGASHHLWRIHNGARHVIFPCEVLIIGKEFRNTSISRLWSACPWHLCRSGHGALAGVHPTSMRKRSPCCSLAASYSRLHLPPGRSKCHHESGEGCQSHRHKDREAVWDRESLFRFHARCERRVISLVAFGSIRACGGTVISAILVGYIILVLASFLPVRSREMAGKLKAPARELRKKKSAAGVQDLAFAACCNAGASFAKIGLFCGVA